VRCAALLAVLLLLGCAPRNGSGAADERSERASPDGPVITLERTACFGRCPVYSVAVSTDGTVQYEGKAHVAHVGHASTRVEPSQIRALLSEIDQAGYFSLPERYTASEPACGRYASDSPSVTTSVKLHGATKRVVHDYGCSNAPGALTVLERRIDDVLGSAQWTGR
jgi:Domain of unknown function (DUF6438)